MSSSTLKLHPDFGGPYGIPFAVVPGSHSKVSVSFDFADESDPGPYPFGSDIPVEDGGDAHALIIDKDSCVLYELFAVSWNGGSPTAGSGAIFDLKANGPLRPDGWTSADAAGLPIFPGLVRWDEVLAGSINHAIRVTAQRTDRSHIWPARHDAGAASSASLPPMGARFRLKASFDISRFSAQAQVVLRAMQKYGLIVADNGSNWYFQGAVDSRWPDSFISELKSVPASAFEAVDESSLRVSPDSGQAKQPGGGGGVPTAQVGPSGLTFPRTTVGAVSAGQTVTVTNTGAASLSVSSVVIGNVDATSFRIASNNCTTLAPAASCSIVVKFAPTSAAYKYGTLKIYDNSSTGSPQKVALGGRGI